MVGGGGAGLLDQLLKMSHPLSSIGPAIDVEELAGVGLLAAGRRRTAAAAAFVTATG